MQSCDIYYFHFNDVLVIYNCDFRLNYERKKRKYQKNVYVTSSSSFFKKICIYLDSCLAILNPRAIETEGDNYVESELKKDIEAAISSRVDESGQSKFSLYFQ